MAIQLFLRLDGVTGGARSFAHKGWCDISSWQWGFQRGGDKGNTNALSLVKPIGIDSPALIRIFAENTVIETAQLNAVPVTGAREAPQKYLEMSMEQVVIQSIQTSGTVDDSAFREELVLTFGRVKYEYHAHVAATHSGGAASSSSLSFDWDIAASAAR